jgi:Tat protein translocase TatB subunit
MSGIGFSELIILFLIGLIVLGPERLPRVANQLGGWLGQARRMTRVMKRQLEEEVNLEKEFNINPNPTVSKPSYVTPANETDDTYSPAHDTDDIGTGVLDEVVSASDGADREETDSGTEDSQNNPLDVEDMDDDIDSALADSTPSEKKKEEIDQPV